MLAGSAYWQLGVLLQIVNVVKHEFINLGGEAGFSFWTSTAGKHRTKKGRRRSKASYQISSAVEKAE